MLLNQLSTQIEGELHTDTLHQAIYATDASVYREYPLGVVYPKHEKDIQTIVRFCHTHQIAIIPRTAGTSLAGQCVGSGLVMDVSKHLTQILDFDPQNGIIRVQPGVIRDELNAFLKPHGWFFGPNTSTANRCMIGGMVGNNSSGSTSVKYGVTRDKVQRIRAVMADGNTETWDENTDNTYVNGLKGLLNSAEVRARIALHFPKPEIHRRNTGYAIDLVSQMHPFNVEGAPLNVAKLLCGSEGTLAISTEITLQLDRLPPTEMRLVAIHFHALNEAMRATQRIMRFAPDACELMDKVILDCTKENREQSENRFFVEGDPAAILIVELRNENEEALLTQIDQLINDLQSNQLGYAYPIIEAKDATRVWNLRAAGLGLLSNIPGPRKALACIEDTAVTLDDLPDYIAEFDHLMTSFGQKAVYYAHAGAGEIHLRPILNLRDEKEFKQFREISEASAKLVKKYGGSLSGEHGDGRVRAEFLPMMIGQENYELLIQIKRLFDPNHILNPGKIVHAAPMDTSLRESPKQPQPNIATFFDYSAQNGYLNAVEKCNGSGDCRKSFSSGGTMCPSYQATKDEKHTTRARANALREFISNSSNGKNAFAHPELKEVLDLCLSCKGCTRECPSNVDMAGLKAEWQYQYQKEHGIPFRNRVLGSVEKYSPLASALSFVVNPLQKNTFTSNILKKTLGIAPERSLPSFASQSVYDWWKKEQASRNTFHESVHLFLDEFTNYQDAELGKKAIALLWRLEVNVVCRKNPGSGRAMISKGLLPEARQQAEKNVVLWRDLVSDEAPLVGIEPSAILGFRDEYPRLVGEGLRENAKVLAKQTFILDEYIAQRMKQKPELKQKLNRLEKEVFVHGHCHQKALSSMRFTREILESAGAKVTLIPSGCCGMAGSFGYEAEHYEVSQKIGEMVLFPAVRQSDENAVWIATGTSCRHQIADGTGREAVHWVMLV